MNHSFLLDCWRVVIVAAIPLVIQATAFAERSGDDSDRGHRRPVYQRHAFEGRGHHGWAGHGRGHDARWNSPQVSAGWFQRPYPYHLDYYKMRYGGSYAPYFGNIYGPPQVVTAPPYYGPYYGGYEAGYAGNGAYQGGAIPPYPNGIASGPPIEQVAPNEEPTQTADGDDLPPPGP